MTEPREPLVPPEVDLRDYDYMPLYGDKLFESDTWGLCNAEEKVAALRLWWRAWHEEPAGSLPNNDRLLAARAGYSEALKAFQAVKENAMRGWIECSDGRLYHPTVASIAIDVWQKKKKKKAENTADRERKRLKRLGARPPDKPEIPPDIQPENPLKEKGSERERELSPTVSNETSGERGASAPSSLSEDFIIGDELLAEAKVEREKAGLPKVNLQAERRKYELHNPSKRSREGWLKWALNARASGSDEVSSAPSTTPAEPDTVALFWEGFPDAGRVLREPQWANRLKSWAERPLGFWDSRWGPKPDHPNCQAPPSMLKWAIQHAIDPDKEAA